VRECQGQSKVVAGATVQVKALHCEIDESIIASAKYAQG